MSKIMCQYLKYIDRNLINYPGIQSFTSLFKSKHMHLNLNLNLMKTITQLKQADYLTFLGLFLLFMGLFIGLFVHNPANPRMGLIWEKLMLSGFYKYMKQRTSL